MKVTIKGTGMRMTATVGGTLEQKLKFIEALTGVAAPTVATQPADVNPIVRELDRHFSDKEKPQQ